MTTTTTLDEAYEIRLRSDVQIVPEAESAESAGAAAPRRFSIRAYSGQPVEDWMHGRMVIDLATLRWRADNRIPIVFEHDTMRPLGVTQSVRLAEQGLVLEGAWIPNDDASRILQAADAGFPWEASIGAKLGRTVEVAAGETVTVNGVDLWGPLLVCYDTTIRECSVAALGRDANTETRALSGRRRNKEAMTMAEADTDTIEQETETVPGTVEDMKTKYPECAAIIDAAIAAARAEGIAEGIQQERDRASGIADAGDSGAEEEAEMSTAKLRHIKEGSDLTVALSDLLRVGLSSARRRALQRADEDAETSEADGGDGDSADPTEVAMREWRATPTLQSRFSKPEYYAAYQRARTSGIITTTKKED